MFRSICILFFITLLPFFELRASIPLGMLRGSIDLPLGVSIRGFELPWFTVFLICVLSNALLGALLYPLVHRFIHLLEHIPFFGRFWEGWMKRTQRNIHPYVEKWGTLGVALFIGVPLPGSGSYSGALGSYLLGMSYRRFLVANSIGVLFAGIAVTILTLTGQGVINSLK